MVEGVHSCWPPQNVTFLYPLYWGRKLDILRRPIKSTPSHFEGDPTISKIGNVPLQNIQRVGPQPKSL